MVEKVENKQLEAVLKLSEFVNAIIGKEALRVIQNDKGEYELVCAIPEYGVFIRKELKAQKNEDPNSV
jgi:hypothetical protein